MTELHVNYETQAEYDRLRVIETQDVHQNWRVEKMRFSKDRTQLRHNEFLTIADIPNEVFQYQLGTRSAWEWGVNQYWTTIEI